MGAPISLTVKGGKQVERNILVLSVKMSKAVERGLIRGADVIANQSFINAPLLHGNLKKSTSVVSEGSVNPTPAFMVPKNPKVTAQMKQDYPQAIQESKSRIASSKNIEVEIIHTMRYSAKTHARSSSPDYLALAAAAHGKKATVFVQDELRKVL